MIRVGLTGMENSHVHAILDYLNAGTPQRARVEAVTTGGDDGHHELARRFGVAAVVEAAHDMLGLIDVVIVCDRHGGSHRASAAPFLTAGIPVLVDKPFACDSEDARTMLRWAAEHGGVLASSSPLSALPEVVTVRGEVGESPVRTVRVVGPADLGSSHGGLHYYGSHHADVALRFARGDISAVSTVVSSEGAVATLTVGETEVCLEFVTPDSASGFSLEVVTDSSRWVRQIHLDDLFLRPWLDEFFAAVDSGAWPRSAAEMLAPVQVIEAVAAMLPSGAEGSAQAHD